MSRRQCRALTADGKPCRNWRLNADGLCWRHDGRPAPAYRRRQASQAPRSCRVCGQERPARAFGVGPTNHKTGVAYRKGTCLECEEKARRSVGIPKRHQRYNSRGDVWCNNCERYRTLTEFKRHPSRPRTYWAYCKECTRALDRLRARHIRGSEAWRRDIDRRVQQKRRRRAKELRERRELVRDAIALLRRRGLTKSEICRLAGVSLGNLLKWERGAVRCDPNVAARLGELLLATAGWPLGDAPAFRRQLRHPELPAVRERMATVIAAYPVRSRWRTNA